MKNNKLKIKDLRVKSLVTSPRSNKVKKKKGNDGGYTWVG